MIALNVHDVVSLDWDAPAKDKGAGPQCAVLNAKRGNGEVIRIAFFKGPSDQVEPGQPEAA